MSKGDVSWDSYPSDGLEATGRALFEAWDSLEKFRRDLVLVGGLSVYLHTRDTENPTYGGAPTLDVDFGISLGTDAGLKGTVFFDLLQAGYRSVDNRMVKTLESGADLYLDFLTEHPPQTKGSRNVSDIVASICPGINRALEEKEIIEIHGVDRFGDRRTFNLPVCGVGPLLVLKLNAFAQRTHGKKAKDAYDILALVSSYSGGALAAVEAFTAEKEAKNPAMERALETLAQDFTGEDDAGPVLARQFRFGKGAEHESGLRLQTDLATIGQALLGE